MKNFIYKLPQVSEKKNFIFNIFGSGANAAVSALLLIFVSRILGENGAGLFALTFPTAQMLYTVASFEVRNVQITDVKKEFEISDILGYRILSIILMGIVCGGFILWKGYSGSKAILLVLFCVYMAVLAVSDAFQGLLHLNGHLDIAGKSLGFRVLSCAVAFIATLILSKKLLIAAVPMICVAVAWVLFYDVPYCRNFGKLGIKFQPTVLKALFFSALPLFLSAFLQQYIFNSPKYAIDTFLSEVEQSYYGFLIMPTSFINLFSIFAFRPQLVGLSKKLHSKDYKGFDKVVIKLFLFVLITAVVIIIGGYFLGIQVLNILYSTNLNALRNEFALLLIAGGFSAGTTLSLTLLTVMRKQKYGLIAFIATAIFSLIVPDILVKKFGISGAAWAYLAEMFMLFAMLFVIFIISRSTIAKKSNKTKV